MMVGLAVVEWNEPTAGAEVRVRELRAAGRLFLVRRRRAVEHAQDGKSMAPGWTHPTERQNCSINRRNS
jgi:hypothetical protein